MTLKVKRSGKTKTPSRKARKPVLRTAKELLQVKKHKKPAKQNQAKSAVVQSPAEALPLQAETPSPFAALISEHSVAQAWEILGDEEFVLDDEVWDTLYNRIKLQLLQASYSFRVESDGLSLSPWAVTPTPAFRSNGEPGFLQAGSFTVLRPELPGVIFDLKISASDNALLIDWALRRKDALPSTGHMALYCDGELVEAVNLSNNRCQLELTREDLGDIVFYFIDAETGRQTKVLELSV